MRKFLFITLCLAFLQTEAQTKEQLIDSLRVKALSKQFHLDALPYYNFGKGVGIISPDSLFKLNIRFRMQNRLELDFEKDKPVEYKAAVRRLRLRFDGYVGNPDFLYVIQLSFSPGDVGKLKDNGYLNVIRDAMVFYKATNKFSLGFGQTKLPGNRQRINSSGALDLTDRSINNAMFNIDRDFGFQAIYSNQKEDAFGYNLKAAISTGDGRNFNDKTDGLAYTGRLELYPFGKFKKNGEFFEGDLQRESKPKLYLGGTYHFNNNANFSQGQRGQRLFENRNLESILLDAMLKYNGWSASTSYMTRYTDNPITYSKKNKNDFNYVMAGHGYDTQLSYIFKNNWEIIGRYSHNVPDKEIQNFTPQQNQYSFGITKYIWEHAFKAQIEVGKNDFKYLNGQENSDWYTRFQVEIGI